MTTRLIRWVSATALALGLGLAGMPGRAWGSQAMGDPGTSASGTTAVNSADAEKAALNSFTAIYGMQEKAALASRAGDDNLQLAKTLFADAGKITGNAAMVRLMRDRAATLLYKSGDSAAYPVAVELEKTALAADQAPPLSAAQQLADMVAAGVKLVPAADRPPLYAQLVELYQTLSALQIRARLLDDAIKSLTQLSNFANAAANRDASKDANALAFLLRAMKSNADLLAKDLAALEKASDDQKLNTEVALLLVRDWGDVTGTAAYVGKADVAQLKSLPELQKFEAAGGSLEGLTADQIKDLAGGYENWAKDPRASKLGRLILTKRAAALYQALSSTLTDTEAAQAARTAEGLNDNAMRYEKEAGTLLAVVSGGAVGSAPAAGSARGAGIPQKSMAEINRLIDTDGAKDPDWLATTQMNYPNSLDLTWQKPPQGSPWNQSKWLGQYIWSTVNENPSQWQNGVKVMYKVMDVNKNDPDKLKQTYNALARMHFNFFKDYARAAYWWKKADNTQHLSMAHCYYHLGNLDAAKKILAQYPYDTTRHAEVTSAWATFGDYDRAMKLAKGLMDTSSPDVGYLAAGDVSRLYQKYEEALGFYDQVLKLKGKAVSRDYPKNEVRARDGYDTIKYFNLFDLSKVPDGTYKASATGYKGPVESVVTVKGQKITDIKINHREDQSYSSTTDIPAAIIAKQTVKGIDATSGATMTANAIIMGTAKAVGDAAKP